MTGTGKAAMAALLALALGQGTAMAQPRMAVHPGTPPPDCERQVGFDRNAVMPGYQAMENGETVCIPFMPTAQFTPDGFRGEFHADEFTDARIRARWVACRAEETCAAAARRGAVTFTSAERRRTGSVDSNGLVDPQGEVDLRAIRRPAFFGLAPFQEAIAAAESRAFTVEFTVPRDSYERLHLNRHDPIRLRGWYLEGEGIAAGAGRRRALVVMATGAGKTRTVIALCDLLMQANWAKRILFLAGRVALVNQAVNAFKTHLPAAAPVNLVTDRTTEGRVYVSTYPTMMGLINDRVDTPRRFGVGHFGLIIVDEAHRSIYQKYGAIFDYFDGLLVPAKPVSVPLKFPREGIKYHQLSDDEKALWDEAEWDNAPCGSKLSVLRPILTSHKWQPVRVDRRCQEMEPKAHTCPFLTRMSP